GARLAPCSCQPQEPWSLPCRAGGVAICGPGAHGGQSAGRPDADRSHRCRGARRVRASPSGGSGLQSAALDSGVSDCTGGMPDLIVVGAGAGGMTAALVAALDGLRVVLCEASNQVGGT